MGSIEDNGHFRYRTFVKIIGVLDVIFALFLIGFYLVRLACFEGNSGDMTTGIFYKYGIIKSTEPFYYFIDELQKYYMLIWVAIFFTYTLQLVMAIILVFGACQSGTEEARRRCKRWCSSLAFIKMTIGIEFFVLCQTYAKFGLRYSSLGILVSKLMFRLLAERVVRAYIKDLSSNQVYSYGARNSYPFY